MYLEISQISGTLIELIDARNAFARAKTMIFVAVRTDKRYYTTIMVMRVTSI